MLLYFIIFCYYYRCLVLSLYIYIRKIMPHLPRNTKIYVAPRITVTRRPRRLRIMRTTLKRGLSCNREIHWRDYIASRTRVVRLAEKWHRARRDVPSEWTRVQGRNWLPAIDDDAVVRSFFFRSNDRSNRWMCLRRRARARGGRWSAIVSIAGAPISKHFIAELREIWRFNKNVPPEVRPPGTLIGRAALLPFLILFFSTRRGSTHLVALPLALLLSSSGIEWIILITSRARYAANFIREIHRCVQFQPRTDCEAAKTDVNIFMFDWKICKCSF